MTQTINYISGQILRPPASNLAYSLNFININMNYDDIIINIIYSKSRPSQKFLKNKIKYSNVVNYLLNRFDYVENVRESLDRIKYHIEYRPCCKKCGNIVKYIGLRNGYPKYRDFCSCKCSMNSEQTKENLRKSIQDKYGVDNVFQDTKIKERIKNTWINKYGVDNPRKSESIIAKINNTSIRRYGTSYPTSSTIVQDNIKKSILAKYGCKYYFLNNEFKEKSKLTCVCKYGVDNYMKSEKARIYMHEKMSTIEVQQKRINTCIKHNTFNTSKVEEELHSYIKEKFPSVKRQYRDKERYPYNCDFYIPEFDLFLELQGNWTHGKHAFDSTSKEDQVILEEWKEKSKEHPYYSNAIKTWTIYDVNKRNKAKENNLNFKEVWSLDEGKAFINNL